MRRPVGGRAKSRSSESFFALENTQRRTHLRREPRAGVSARRWKVDRLRKCVLGDGHGGISVSLWRRQHAAHLICGPGGTKSEWVARSQRFKGFRVVTSTERSRSPAGSLPSPQQHAAVQRPIYKGRNLVPLTVRPLLLFVRAALLSIFVPPPSVKLELPICIMPIIRTQPTGNTVSFLEPLFDNHGIHERKVSRFYRGLPLSSSAFS